MNSLIVLFFVVLAINADAQTAHPTCNGTRYLTEEFSNVDTTFNVLFGINTTYQGNVDSLYMDVYQPVGDAAIKRPLMILAFGGSFVIGERTDMAPLCHYYAQRGFVAATIDYRLFDGPFVPFPDSTVFADVVMKAIGDMKASIRYFREDEATSNLYKIDPNLVFVGGGSAGAIMALHVAYLDSMDNIPSHIQTAINNNGGYEGNTASNTQYSSEVHGVINFSGALGDASWMDAGDVPLFSAHDDNDNIVPYGQGYATIAGFPVSYLEGSQVVADTATALGIPNVLITIPNSNGHVSYVNDPQWQDSIFTGTLEFLHKIICPVMLPVSAPLMQKTMVQIYPNPANNYLNIRIDNLSTSYDLTLYNNLGQIVYQQQNMGKEELVISREKLETGVYYLHLQFEDPERPPISKRIIFQE